MKVALSGMVLGASMLGAHAASLGTSAYTFKDGTTLSFDSDKLTKTGAGVIQCTPGYEIDADMANQGKAYRDYDDTSITVGQTTASLRDDYESGDVLTYYCGISDGTGGYLIGDPGVNNPSLHKADNRIRVDLVGTCSEKAVFVAASTAVADSYSISNPIANNYVADSITAKIDFKCKQPEGFAPTVDASLKFVQKTVADTDCDADCITAIGDIVKVFDSFGNKLTLTAADVTKSALALTRDNGKEFSLSTTKTYSLGTDKAHPDYYDSGGCNAGNDLCKGALHLKLNQQAASRSDGDLTFDRPTSLADETNFAPTRPQFVQCNQTKLTEEKSYLLYDACYPAGHAATELVPGTLLDTLVCPFKGVKSHSTAAYVTDCVNDGKVESEAFDNTCAGIETRLENKVPSVEMTSANKADIHVQELTSVVPGETYKYSFKYQFLESGQGAAQRFQDTDGLDELVISGNAKTTLSADERSFTYTISLSADDVTTLNAKASDFFVKANVAGASWMKQVNLGETMEVKGIPSIATNIRLFGQVYQTCSKAETELSKQLDLVRDTHLKETGSFEQVALCSDRFEYKRSAQDQDDDLTVMETVFGTGAQGIVRICETGYDTTDAHCQEEGGSSLILRADDGNAVFAHITGTCDNIKDGVYGGLVEFDQELSPHRAAAPVLCKGTCTNAVMHNLKLDWSVEFTVSSQAGSENNKLVADQAASSWEDPARKMNGEKYFKAKKFAYLINPDTTDECGADGVTISTDTQLEALGNSAKDGDCLVYKQIIAEDGSGDPVRDDGLNTATDVQRWLARCGTATDGGSKAKLVQRFSIDYDSDYVDQNTSMVDESFCHVRDLEVTVQTLVVDSIEGTLTVAQMSDPDAATRLSTNIGNVQYEQDDSGSYRVKVSIDIDGGDTNTGWTEDSTTSGFFGDTYDKDAGTVTWVTGYENVCDDSQGAQDILGDWNRAEGHIFAGRLSRASTSLTSGNDEVSFSFKVNLQGDPCDRDKSISAGQVELALYKVEPQRETNTAVSAHVCSADTAEEILALQGADPHTDGGFCGRLTLSNMGNFKFTILDTMVTRQTQGSEPIFLCEKAGDSTNQELCVGNARGQLFLFGADDTSGLNTDVSHAVGQSVTTLASNNVFQLDNVDAFSTIKYTIFWKQELPTGGRRLLRSTHIFGAGDHESVASLVVLPASAQIEDAVESLDASVHEEGHEETTAAPDAAEEDSGLTGGQITAIIIAGVVVAGGVAYVAMEALKPKDRRPKKREYTAVRRSERFSTMNF